MLHETIEGFNLSPQQKHVWRRLSDSQKTPYIVQCSVIIEGGIDSEVLKAALQNIIEQHEILRTTFHSFAGMPFPLQVTSNDISVLLEEHDLMPFSAAEQAAQIEQYSQTAYTRPLDFEKGPLLHFSLLQLSDEKHVLLVCLPALCADMASLKSLVLEIGRSYDAILHGEARPDEPLQYVAIAEWQNELLEAEEAEEGRNYWSNQTIPTSPTLLFEQSPSTQQAFQPKSYPISISDETIAKLEALAEQYDTSPPVVLLASWQAMLWHLTRQSDIVIGTAYDGRKYEELEESIGLFVKYLPIVGHLSASTSFQQLIHQLRHAVDEAYDYQEYFSWEQMTASTEPTTEPDIPSFSFDYIELPEPYYSANVSFALDKYEAFVDYFKLKLSCREGADGVTMTLAYDASLFAAGDIERLARQLQILWQNISDAPSVPLGQLSVLEAHEHTRLLVDFNRTDTAYPHDKCLHHLFEAQVARTPDNTAVIFGDQRLTYAELDARANQLAHYLQQLGVGPEVPVAICLERSVEMIVGLLGILKTGGVYVPLDATLPQERIAFILADTQAPILLTHHKLEATRTQHPAKLVFLDSDWDTISQESTNSVVGKTSATNLAYIIYTSGSTGIPKGVMVTHQGVVNYLSWCMQAYDVTSGPGGTPLHSPIGFDLTVTSLFPPLLCGRSVHILPEEEGIGGLVTTLQSNRDFSLVKITPSHLEVLRQQLPADQAAGQTRALIIGGEALMAHMLTFWQTHAPETKLVNEYGPTETVVGCCTYEVRSQLDMSGAVPIGRPIANTQLYVLNEYLQPVPTGIPGELYIGGVGVARGYLNRPGLTAETFIPNPFSSEPGSRLYKTGDLVQHRPDGNLEFLGRLDHQVKIRGYRIELGEIQAVLSQHPDIGETAVIAHADESGNKRLVAYFVPQEDATIASVNELRDFLQNKLPDYMIPATFSALDALPLTPNGKLDRKALPAPDSARPNLKQAYVAPRTPVEEVLAMIWAQVLDLEQVGIDDNFFALGGDSIRGIQVRALAQEKGFIFSLQDLFRCQTIRQLAQVVQRHSGLVSDLSRSQPFTLISEQDRQKLPAGLQDAYPLTMLQAGMFFHSELAPDSAIYHDLLSIHLKAPFDVEVFKMAMQQLFERHSVLRTSFDFTHFSTPLQLVHKEVPLPLYVEDFRHLLPAEQEKILDEWFEAEKSHHFDWGEQSFLRIYVHRRTEASFQFTLSLHHAILDGWSVAATLTEAFAFYAELLNAQDTLPSLGAPLALEFRDFVALEQEVLNSEEALQYWKHKLADATVATLPNWKPPAQAASTPQAQVFNIPIASEVSADLNNLARETAVPIKSVLLAAHVYVMHLLSGQTDVITGLVTNGRPESVDGERILGLFLNTLPFRQCLRGGSWLDLVQHAFKAEWEMLPYRRYPLAYLQRLHGGEELFTTVFNFMHFHIYESVLQRDDFHIIGESKVFEQTNFVFMANFSLDIVTSQVQLALNYDVTALTNEQVQTIGAYYQNVLTAMAHEPHSRYDAHNLLPVWEQQLLRDWNGTQVEYPQTYGATIHHLFEAQAAQTPDAIAVTFGDEQLTYHELNQRANQLARYLQTLGVGPEQLVSICVERSLEMIVAILGVIKAGGAYVPLDPAYPRQRLAFMMTDAQTSVLLTQRRLIDQQFVPVTHLVCLDTDWERIAEQSTDDLSSDVTAENLAYLLYTSGSTGRPKGVAITHRSAVEMLRWAQSVFPPADLQGTLAVTSICFDLSVYELFLPLCQGGTVILAENAVHLLELPHRESVTLINTVPSAIAKLLQVGGIPSSVRTINLAGEPLKRVLVNQLYNETNVERVYNLYGPSEDTTYSTFAQIERESLSKPLIGGPIHNTQAYVLNAHMQPVPIGVIGELYLGGKGLARCYLNRPNLTADKFVPDPFSDQPGSRLYRTGDLVRYRSDGSLEFMGRVDHQVKLRGYRIELGEIESILAQHPAVHENAVLVQESETNQKSLVAYIVPDKSKVITNDDRPLYRLPNQMEIAYQSKVEAEHIYEDIFERQCYLQHGLTIEEGDCIVDVGGNIGLFTLYAHHTCQNIAIYAFEPVPKLFEIFRFNAARHGVNVKAFNYGLSDETKSATITFYPNSSGMSSIHANEEEEKAVLRTIMHNQLDSGMSGMAELMQYSADLLEERFKSETLTCQLKTLSEVIAENQIDSIDLLKIDVQKSELEVLRGIQEQDWYKIKQITMEVHELDGRLSQIQALLENKGFDVAIEQDPLMHGTVLYNLYARRVPQKQTRDSKPHNVTHFPSFLNKSALATELRNFLRERLPLYMVPSNFVVLDALPLTPNGKIDRRALAAITVERQLDVAFAPPSNELEKTIAAIWKALLPVKKIGVHDNFFDLGGHSLLLLQIHGKLNQALNQEVSIVDLFTYPTIRSLATYLKSQQKDGFSLDESVERAQKRKAMRRKKRSRR